MKKFLSNSLSGVPAGVGDPLAEGEAPTAGADAAGDMPATVAVVSAPGEVLAPGTAGAAGEVTGMVVAGEVAGAVAGDIAGAVAGLMAVVGGAPGGLATGDVAGEAWPNEVSA